jgi:hypothetical protein
MTTLKPSRYFGVSNTNLLQIAVCHYEKEKDPYVYTLRIVLRMPLFTAILVPQTLADIFLKE